METSQQENQKKVGLALSGGFIRSVAGIGVIEVLEENNVPIDLVSGCSAGAAVAGAYAAGSLDKLKKRLIEGRRRDYWRVIIEPAIPKKGLLKGERNRKFFEEFVEKKDFCQLNKKLILVATDLRKMEEVIISEGMVSEAIQAATAVPGMFVPVEREGRILADGGNFNMIPSKVLYQNGANYVIAVYLSQPPNLITQFLANFKKRNGKGIINNFSSRSKDLNIFQLIRRAVNLSSHQIHNLYHQSYPYDILIRPQTENIKRWYVGLAQYCIEEGRQAALEALPKIKRDLGL